MKHKYFKNEKVAVGKNIHESGFLNFDSEGVVQEELTAEAKETLLENTNYFEESVVEPKITETVKTEDESGTVKTEDESGTVKTEDESEEAKHKAAKEKVKRSRKKTA